MTRLKAIKSSEFGAEAACMLYRVRVPASTQLVLGDLFHSSKDGEVWVDEMLSSTRSLRSAGAAVRGWMSEMVSVVLGLSDLQREVQVCPTLGSLDLDVVWLPDLPDHCLSAKFISLTFPSQHLRRAAWKKEGIYTMKKERLCLFPSNYKEF